MTITINDFEIADAEIDAEAVHHASAPSPREAAACALAIRELLLQRAKESGLADAMGGVESDVLIERLLDIEAPVPRPSEKECRNVYDRRRDRFVVGELVEASHILFAVTPNAPVEALRRQAESTLAKAIAEPGCFAEFAKALSNCPSAAQGGNLGQIQRGDMVPEFESAVFSAAPGVLPRLVKSRYGFHIVRIERQVPGRVLEFAQARPHIEAELSARVHARAAEQYVRMLAAKAKIVGVDLRASDSPLVQ